MRGPGLGSKPGVGTVATPSGGASPLGPGSGLHRFICSVQAVDAHRHVLPLCLRRVSQNTCISLRALQRPCICRKRSQREAHCQEVEERRAPHTRFVLHWAPIERTRRKICRRARLSRSSRRFQCRDRMAARHNSHDTAHRQIRLHHGSETLSDALQPPQRESRHEPAQALRSQTSNASRAKASESKNMLYQSSSAQHSATATTGI